MTVPTVEALRATLGRMAAPGGGPMLPLIDSIDVRGGLVHVALKAERSQAPAMERLRQAAQDLLARQPGVTNATVVLTSHRAEPAPAAPAAHDHAHAHGKGAEKPKLLPGVRHIVAVASGKGGVGKSTTAVNIAVALAQQGHRVGLLDADIYGPSLPRMLGLAAKPDVREGRMIPLEAWGLRVMSIGFLVDADTAMIWRGPMVMGALEQMMGQVAWGELDMLVVDMPPGTGDAQLTMAQRVSLSGAVIVSTPQDIALIDARRGVRMFEKTMVPVLGLVENMSMFCCPNCGHATPLFGHGGARREAEALGVPFLGEVPLLLDIRTTADAGTPITASDPDSAAAEAYRSIAARVWQSLATPRPAAPRILQA
jgi:ATP-binding protein involved in chromosome partitioning